MADACVGTGIEEPIVEVVGAEGGAGAVGEKMTIKVKRAIKTSAKIELIHKPLLKWVGGKTQILSDILMLFPDKINNYYEPFVGGGSVLLALLSYIKQGKIKLSGKIFASDLNSNLINLYKNIQLYPLEVIKELKCIVDEYTNIKGNEVNRKALNIQQATTSQESYYFWIRTKFNEMSSDEKQTTKASAMLLFMNKTCFRGVYREGPHGLNVPFGNYKNPAIFDEAHIMQVSELLKDVIFTAGSFDKTLADVSKGDFVYLDPPYAPETNTSFVGYNSGGFNIDNHTTLFKLCDDFAVKNIKFLMSNSNVKLVKDSFPSPKYTTKIISCRRAINSKNPESKTNEVLITNQ